jgi:hypothetical protein
MLRLLSCLALVLMASCSGKNAERIVGHWQSENFQLQGMGLPIGPQLDIDAHAMRVSGTELIVPITRMEANGDAVTLVVPAGIDLTFHFERTDRMYIDLPLLGPVYYQRRALDSTPTPTPPLAAAQAAVTTAVVIPAAVPVRAALAVAPDPASVAEQSFAGAVLSAKSNEPDAALRQLDDALRQGFSDWARLDANRTLQALRTDPRYDALMARWRAP